MTRQTSSGALTCTLWFVLVGLRLRKKISEIDVESYSVGAYNKRMEKLFQIHSPANKTSGATYPKDVAEAILRRPGMDRHRMVPVNRKLSKRRCLQRRSYIA